MLKKEVALLIGITFLAGILLSGSAMGLDQAEAQGHGAFHATGGGFGKIHGKGVVTLKGDGVESVLIRNVSKTQISIMGKGVVLPLPGEDSILILGLKGKVQLKGKNVVMLFAGGPLVVKGAGHGKIWLKGKGKLKIKDKPLKDWPPKLHKFEY